MGRVNGGHVVLLGDSILDNGAYVGGEPDVVAQVGNALPEGWSATLLAVDGDVISGVRRQLSGCPDDATHLVVSAGGNDALGFAYLLNAPVSSVAEAIATLGAQQVPFTAAYEEMLDAVLATGLPVAVCTIYDTPRSAPSHAVIRSAIGLFNDCITRAAFARGVDLLDLRLICSEDADYANPIEPSSAGGRKIARAIAEWATGDQDPSLSRVIR
ncbi:SGNH/GDSL hydrolase family protein [Microbacteriaceae bacterium 4G12]